MLTIPKTLADVPTQNDNSENRNNKIIGLLLVT